MTFPVKAARHAHVEACALAGFLLLFFRRRRPPGRGYRLLLTLSISAFFLGCAAEGPPQPPRVERPQRIKDLAAQQIGRSIELKLTLPRLATDGERLTKPIELQLFRAVAPPHQAPASPLTTGKPWVSLDSASLARYRHGSELVYVFTLSPNQFRQLLGSTLSFLAVSQVRGFRGRTLRSAASNLGVVHVMDVPKPPRNLTVQAKPKVLVLHWSAPRATLSGRPVTSKVTYQVYASATGQPRSFRLLGTAATTEFEDGKFEFGEHYVFKVRAIVVHGREVAESESSNLVDITPLDIFPPPTPRGLSGFYSAGVVELVWKPDTEANLAGYRVYRRQNHEPFTLLNKTLAQTPVYRDRDVKAGQRYIYAVSAVNQAGYESAKSLPIVVKAGK